MLIGYSLSPGGLLFPWHIGALASLSHNNALNDCNPLAGSSAGAIAAASHGAGVRPEVALEATIRMSDESRTLGGARGNLLPLLKCELDNILDDDVHEVLNNREGFVGLAYRELIPNNQAVLDTKFDDREHVIDSVCNSSTFPFFSSKWPCRIARKKPESPSLLPRIAVDGYFTVDRDRFGCPDFDNMDHARDSEGNAVDRTVTLSVFPHDVIKLTASEKHDQISPLIDEDNVGQISNLFRLATQCAEKEEYYKLYEDGWKDAERWFKEEEAKGYWDASTEERRRIYAEAVRNQALN